MKGKRASQPRRSREKNTGWKSNMVVLLIYESEDTERLYIRDFLKSSNPHARIYKECHGGEHPKNIIQTVYKKYERDWENFDKIWLIFDDDGRKNIDAAIREARHKGISLALSNPCFELWYLLHFIDHQQYRNQRSVIKLLRQHLPNYKKTESFYASVATKQSMAIDRAKHLQQVHSANGKPVHFNPSTTMFELVEFFLELSSDRSAQK